MSARRWSLVAALFTMFLWGVNFAFVKYLLDTLGVGAFLFIRFLTMPALAFLLLAFVFRRRIARTWPRREDLPRFIACGLIGHALHVGFVFWGAERLRASQVPGTLVACLGISLFLSEKFAGGVLHAGFGDLLLLVAAALFSLYTVLVRPLVERYGPLIVLAYTLLFGAPPMLLLSLPSMFTAELHRLTPMVWFGLFWAIVVGFFLAHVASCREWWVRISLRMPAPVVGCSYVAAMLLCMVMAPMNERPFLYLQF